MPRPARRTDEGVPPSRGPRVAGGKCGPRVAGLGWGAVGQGLLDRPGRQLLLGAELCTSASGHERRVAQPTRPHQHVPHQHVPTSTSSCSRPCCRAVRLISVPGALPLRAALPPDRGWERGACSRLRVEPSAGRAEATPVSPRILSGTSPKLGPKRSCCGTRTPLRRKRRRMTGPCSGHSVTVHILNHLLAGLWGRRLQSQVHEQRLPGARH
jgi:hypothetical protein